MYLSRIELNLSLTKTMKALESPSIIHGAVESSFYGERKRRLWRIDEIGGKKYVLVLSEDIPNFKNFARQFGYPDKYETKDYSQLLDKIINGSKLHFRLVANPTVTRSSSDNKSKNVPHTTPKYQKMWLINRAEKCGFSLKDNEFQTVGNKWYRFYKNEVKSSSAVCLLSVTYEGILIVTDVNKFKKILCTGIGREKAYGQGLLTVIRM